MKKMSICIGILAIVAVALAGTAARADDEGRSRHRFRAELKGSHESPVTLSAARGRLQLTVSDDDSSVHFVLSYAGLQTPVMFAHIHVGQPNINGAVTVFFCGGGTKPDPCPQQEGEVQGDITAADVGAITSQQLAANDLAKLLRAIRKGQTYANVHTMTSPGGEIRGQIRAKIEAED